MRAPRLEAAPLSASFQRPLLLQPSAPAGPTSWPGVLGPLPQAGEASVLSLSAILENGKCPRGTGQSGLTSQVSVLSGPQPDHSPQPADFPNTCTGELYIPSNLFGHPQ